MLNIQVRGRRVIIKGRERERYARVEKRMGKRINY